MPMKRLFGAVSALALLTVGGAALAEEATGTIESLDHEAMTLTLDTGESFTLAEGVSIEGLEAGAEVTVAYEEEDGRFTATAIDLVEVAAVEEAAPEEEVEEMHEEPEEAAD
jgi:hypothetical protein